MLHPRSIFSFVVLAICGTLVAEAQNYNCGDRGRFPTSAVNSAYANAPHTSTPGKSGYPHKYGNSEKLQFPMKCRTFNPQTMVLMELPATSDGKPYPWDEKRPKDKDKDASPFRIVYTANIHTGQKQFFCGLMVHPADEKSIFRLCTPPALRLGNGKACEDGGQCPLVEQSYFIPAEEEDEYNKGEKEGCAPIM